MDIVESTADGILTLAMNGKLDADSTDGFAASLNGFIDRGDRRIVLDLAGVEYMSSVGLRALIGGAKRLMPLGGKIVLAAPKPRIRQVLEISGFTSIFTITATRDEAAAALR
jgi:anti-anti-sigma factor